MSGDQLNLDAIEARAKNTPLAYAGNLLAVDVPALVEEVRRLRSLLDDAGRGDVTS